MRSLTLNCWPTLGSTWSKFDSNKQQSYNSRWYKRFWIFWGACSHSILLIGSMYMCMYEHQDLHRQRRHFVHGRSCRKTQKTVQSQSQWRCVVEQHNAYKSCYTYLVTALFRRWIQHYVFTNQPTAKRPDRSPGTTSSYLRYTSIPWLVRTMCIFRTAFRRRMARST